MNDLPIILVSKLASAIEHINAGGARELVLGRLRVELNWIIFINRPGV